MSYLPRLIQVTEAAAIAAAYQMGRGNKSFADQVAVASMRRMLNKLDMKGIIKIGEGERDEAPMLYIGEQVGTGKGNLEVDIAVDPLRRNKPYCRRLSWFGCGHGHGRKGWNFPRP